MTEVSTYESKMADLESEQLDSQEREVCEQMQVLQRKLDMIQAEKSRLRNNRQNWSSSQGSVCDPTMNQAISKKTTAPINKSKRGSIFSSLNPFKSSGKQDKKNGDQDSVVSVTSVTSTQSSTVTSKSGRSSRRNHHKSPEHMMVPANNRRLGASSTLHEHRQSHHAINTARRGGVHRSASQQDMRRQLVPGKVNFDLQANVVHGEKHEIGNEQGFGTPTSQRSQGPYGGSKRKAQRSHSMTPIRSNHSRSRHVMDQETESYRPGVLLSHQPRQASKEPQGSTMPKKQQTVQKRVPPPMQMPSKQPRGSTAPIQQQTVQKRVPPPMQVPTKQLRGGTMSKQQQTVQKPVPPPMPMPTNFLSELKAKAGSGDGFDLKKTDGEKQVKSAHQNATPRPKTMPTNFLDELKAKAGSGDGFDLKTTNGEKQPQSGRKPSPMAAPVSLLDELKAKTSSGGLNLKKPQTRRQSLPVPKKAGPVSLLDELKMKTTHGGRFDLKKTEVPVKPKIQPSAGNSILAQLQRNKTFAAIQKQEEDWS